MSETADRVRLDVWLWRARFVKTRAEASRLITEGGVRVMRDGLSRRLDKASATIGPGDQLVLPLPAGLKAVRVQALGARRGPPGEARDLYADLPSE